jgi:hypothetical protein
MSRAIPRSGTRTVLTSLDSTQMTDFPPTPDTNQTLEHSPLEIPYMAS